MTRYHRVFDLGTGQETSVPYTPEEEAAADAYVDPVPVIENISKNIIWERMTEQEAAQADTLLRAQPAKIYRQYDGATYISTKAELYPLLLGAMKQLFGEQRAAEILEPNF